MIPRALERKRKWVRVGLCWRSAGDVPAAAWTQVPQEKSPLPTAGAGVRVAEIENGVSKETAVRLILEQQKSELLAICCFVLPFLIRMQFFGSRGVQAAPFPVLPALPSCSSAP